MITTAPKTCLRMPRCRGIEIEECSISQLQDYLSKAAFTSKELVQCYLRRIELVNPYVKAVIETNPDALDIADELDEERKNGHVRTLLHGIPFIVKDNIATKDKMQTTAGCAALAGTVVPSDARVITLLREAGAVLLGKANLSEFASMRASYYAEGYSSRGGQNRNPYNLAHHPGGSSSGSASSLASNMCAFSIGTETDGSIMFPADRNAVVGLKPTVGLTSTMGVIPESPSMDTVGPFGRSVEDATIVLDIIHERRATTDNHIDRLVSTSVQSQNSCPGPYTSWLSKKDVLKGARFGIPWKRVWETASTNATNGLEYDSLMELIKKIEKAGALVVKVDFQSAEEIISPGGWDWEFGDGKTGSRLSEFEVVRTEFYRSLQSYLNELEETKIYSLEDVVTYNIQHTTQEGGVPRTHPAWPTGQDNFDKCLESKDWPEDIYLKALEYIRRKSRDEGIDTALRLEGDDNLDGLLVPLQADGGVACSVAAKAGYPMITVPVGIDNIGVPFGIGIIQTAFKEHLLVRYGSAIEDLVGRRMVPRFLNLEADNYPYIGTPPEKASLL
jgi:amidase